MTGELMRQAKEYGFSDKYMASLFNITEVEFKEKTSAINLILYIKLYDTGGAEFEAHTPYLYATYENECEANPTKRRKIVILGGGRTE